jgi:hypothetical protein
MNELTSLAPLLERIAVALERLANDGKPVAPNLTKSMESFWGFDWASIGAEIIREDHDGPTHVQHNGLLYTRRSPTNKYGSAIWYSAPAGKDADGNVEYVRLITFKDFSDADPLPRKLEKPAAKPASAGSPQQAPVPPRTAPPSPVVPERPYPAEILKAKLASWAQARKGQPCSEQHRTLLAGMLERAAGGKLPRHEMSEWLFGAASTAEIPCEMVLAALKDWLEIKDWNSAPSQTAITEAHAAHAAAIVVIKATQKA